MENEHSQYVARVPGIPTPIQLSPDIYDLLRLRLLTTKLPDYYRGNREVAAAGGSDVE